MTNTKGHIVIDTLADLSLDRFKSQTLLSSWSYNILTSFLVCLKILIDVHKVKALSSIHHLYPFCTFAFLFLVRNYCFANQDSR